MHADKCPWSEKLRENIKNYRTYGKSHVNGKLCDYDDKKALELASCDACSAHDPLAKSKCTHGLDH